MLSCVLKKEYMLITKCYNLPGTPNSQQNVSTILAMQFSWRLTNLAMSFCKGRGLRL